MILNMISGPRNVSTALMYSFSRHPDFRVVDEPFYGFYLAHSNVDHPGYQEVLNTMPVALEEILNDLNEKAEGNLFLKNMAHHLILVDDRSFLQRMKNIFLIRHPSKLIYSFSKVIERPTLRDIGVKDEYALFHEISQYEDPIVINSDELLKDPESILTKVLSKVGLPFSKKMLTWPKGSKKEDGIWAKYWYDNVHKTTGFGAYKDSLPNLEGHLKELYEEAMPYYEKLNEQAIRV